MGVERFDVLLQDVGSRATIRRDWNRAELLGSVAWLKRMNARGNNIYLRPRGEHGLALVNSLTPENLASMRSKGFAPALTLEVNGNQFQAWVKLSERELPERVRRLAEAGLARAFGGPHDKGVPNGYAWLAGCASHGDRVGAAAPKQAKYVLAHAGSGAIGKPTSAFVEHIKTTLREMSKEKERTAPVQRRTGPDKPHTRDR